MQEFLNDPVSFSTTLAIVGVLFAWFATAYIIVREYRSTNAGIIFFKYAFIFLSGVMGALSYLLLATIAEAAR